MLNLNKIKAIYGAIWTDKGLIYAAKMNDKGELELLWMIYMTNFTKRCVKTAQVRIDATTYVKNVMSSKKN